MFSQCQQFRLLYSTVSSCDKQTLNKSDSAPPSSIHTNILNYGNRTFYEYRFLPSPLGFNKKIHRFAVFCQQYIYFCFCVQWPTTIEVAKNYPPETPTTFYFLFLFFFLFGNVAYMRICKQTNQQTEKPSHYSFSISQIHTYIIYSVIHSFMPNIVSQSKQSPSNFWQFQNSSSILKEPLKFSKIHHWKMAESQLPYTMLLAYFVYAVLECLPYFYFFWLRYCFLSYF